MSFNRRRNIFTLGDYQTHQHPHQYAKAQLSRLRQNSDPFERDPFKIQSYNFHYADKPSYPLQNYVNRVNSQTSVKRFETHFYNYDFAAAGCDKENTAASSTTAATTTANHNGSSNKFHEFRRRKFLHAHQQQMPAATHHMSPYGHSGQTFDNNRQRLGIGNNNNGSNSSLRQQYQRQQQQQQQQYQQDQLQQQQQQQQQQLREPSPHRHQQQHHAFCVPCSSNSVNANANASNMAAIYAYAAPTTHTPLLRTGCNREFLQGIRAVSTSNASEAQHNFEQHCQQQQQQHQQQYQQQQQSRDLQSSKSRSCLPISQRFYSELGCRSSGTGIGGSGSNSTTALNSAAAAAADKNHSGGSGARVSHSQHNNINNVNKRKPLQTLSPKNLVTANVEQRHSASGCHINININGLNATDHLGGENLTIKIESDNRSVRNLNTSSNNLAERVSSPQKADNFNIVPSATNTQTFGIDKRLSKFAISSLREVPSDRSQAERERKVAAVLELEKVAAATATAVTATNATNDFKTIRAPPTNSKTETTPLDVRSSSSHMRRRSKERMPSLVPWNIDDNLRSCFTKENNPNFDTPHNRPTNLMRRIRTNYNSAFRDMKNLQKYADEIAESKRRRTDKKLLNTCCAPAAGVSSQRAEQRKLLQPRILPNLTPPRHCPSRHSMRSNSNEELTDTMHLLKCGSSELERRQQSRQSLNKLPWNVNINVYADKCKLLRV